MDIKIQHFRFYARWVCCQSKHNLTHYKQKSLTMLDVSKSWSQFQAKTCMIFWYQCSRCNWWIFKDDYLNPCLLVPMYRSLPATLFCYIITSIKKKGHPADISQTQEQINEVDRREGVEKIAWPLGASQSRIEKNCLQCMFSCDANRSATARPNRAQII